MLLSRVTSATSQTEQDQLTRISLTDSFVTTLLPIKTVGVQVRSCGYIICHGCSYCRVIMSFVLGVSTVMGWCYIMSSVIDYCVFMSFVIQLKTLG